MPFSLATRNVNKHEHGFGTKASLYGPLFLRLLLVDMNGALSLYEAFAPLTVSFFVDFNIFFFFPARHR